MIGLLFFSDSKERKKKSGSGSGDVTEEIRKMR
jgi:hypothetical protein